MQGRDAKHNKGGSRTQQHRLPTPAHPLCAAVFCMGYSLGPQAVAAVPPVPCRHLGLGSCCMCWQPAPQLCKPFNGGGTKSCVMSQTVLRVLVQQTAHVTADAAHVSLSTCFALTLGVGVCVCAGVQAATCQQAFDTYQRPPVLTARLL